MILINQQRKIKLGWILIMLVLFMVSCTKNETEQVVAQQEIIFVTDKSLYHDLEDIAIKFQNNTSSDLRLDWCRLYYMEQFKNGIWESTGDPPCPYDGSFIIINPNETIFDTIHSNWLDNGKYRFVTYNLSTDTSHISICSNEFEKIEFINFIH